MGILLFGGLYEGSLIIVDPHIHVHVAHCFLCCSVPYLFLCYKVHVRGLKFLSLVASNSKKPRSLKTSNPQTLKPSNPQTLKPSNPQTLKPSNSQTLKLSNSQTLNPKPQILLLLPQFQPRAPFGELVFDGGPQPRAAPILGFLRAVPKFAEPFPVFFFFGGGGEVGGGELGGAGVWGEGERGGRGSGCASAVLS